MITAHNEYRPFIDKREVKYKFLLTFIKVTHKQMFSNIFVALRKITAIKNYFLSNKMHPFLDKSLNILSL